MIVYFAKYKRKSFTVSEFIKLSSFFLSIRSINAVSQTFVVYYCVVAIIKHNFELPSM
jgi:hypothetical protein